MKYNSDKVDEMTLALLYLVSTKRKEGRGARAWKGFDRETLNRLHEKNWIEALDSKSPTLLVTGDGYEKSEQLFRMHFGLKEKQL